MPCSRHLIGSAGDVFRFQVIETQNVLACVGRLRITGPTTGHSQDFTFAQLRAGIGWELEAEMSYTLRILIQPEVEEETVEITARTNAGEDTCSRNGAGQIGVWTIDVL